MDKMLIMDCFSYMDITAELSQYEGVLAVKFKTETDTTINLTFNYMQTKVLADGLLAMIHRMQVKDIVEARTNHLLGDIKVEFRTQEDQIYKNEGGNEACQLNILSAQQEVEFLSKNV